MKYLVVIVLTISSLFCASATVAQSGQPDPTFGDHGAVVTHLGHDVRPLDAVLQPDAKIVVVGGISNFPMASEVAVIVRYLPDGALDTAFGNKAMVTEGISNFETEAQAVILQGDGKIVILERIAGASGGTNDFRLVRFLSNGRLDRSFGLGGRALITFPHPASFVTSVDTLVLQPNQKFLLGGSVAPPGDQGGITTTVVARFTQTGTPDKSFGDNGISQTEAIGAPVAMALLRNGHILAVNNSQRTAEFTSSGARVSPVVGGTVAAATHGGITAFRADATFLLVAGGIGPSGENDRDVRVQLFYSSGESDPNFQSPLFDFGSGGPYSNLGQTIALGPTGEIAVGGLSQSPSFNEDYGVAKLHSDGALDSRFARRGTTTTHFPHGGQVLAMIIQPDGKILAVGQAFSNDTAIPVDLALVRYLTQ